MKSCVEEGLVGPAHVIPWHEAATQIFTERESGILLWKVHTILSGKTQLHFGQKKKEKKRKKEKRNKKKKKRPYIVFHLHQLPCRVSGDTHPLSQAENQDNNQKWLEQPEIGEINL